MRGEQRKIDFGSQIRSYTLHPQQRVKDHRTELESGNVDGRARRRSRRLHPRHAARARAAAAGVPRERARAGGAARTAGGAAARGRRPLSRARRASARPSPRCASASTRWTRRRSTRSRRRVAVVGRDPRAAQLRQPALPLAGRGRRVDPGEREEEGARRRSCSRFLRDLDVGDFVRVEGPRLAHAHRRAHGRRAAGRAAREEPAPAAREVARPDRRRGPLPPAPSRPARERGVAPERAAAQPGRLGAARGPRPPRLPRGGDAHAPAARTGAPPRGRSRPTTKATTRISSCASRTSCT